MRGNSGKGFLRWRHSYNIFEKYKNNRLCGLQHANEVANKNAKVGHYFL